MYFCAHENIEKIIFFTKSKFIIGDSNIVDAFMLVHLPFCVDWF